MREAGRVVEGEKKEVGKRQRGVRNRKKRAVEGVRARSL